jgi:hypothetical protein
MNAADAARSPTALETGGTTEDPWFEQAPLVEEALASGALKIVFVFGVARSGTTWLRELLGRHPAVTAHEETHLFSEYLREVPFVRQRFERKTVGLRRALPAEEERRAWRALVVRFLLAGVADWPSRRVVVEKTPRHIEYASFIRELLPEAHFVCIVRDPRAVVASWKTAACSFGADWASGGALRIAEEWSRQMRAFRGFEPEAEPLRVVRYEQLHADGIRTLHELLGWLGLEATPRACARYVEACRFEKVKAEAPRPEFYRKGRPDAWHEDLSRREIARIEHVAGPLMDELGYVRSRRARWPLPSVWLYQAADRLERGSGWLAERMRL